MWKDVKGFEGYYQVSDDGQVRSLTRTIVQSNGKVIVWKGKVLKQTIAIGKGRKDGYYVVNLRNGTKPHTKAVHLLVAHAFIDNPDGLPTVNHKDGNKLNNRVDNLEWMSYADNNIHALVHKLRHPRKGQRVMQFDKNDHYVATYNTIVQASKMTGMNPGSISHCICGIQKRTCDGSRFVRVQEGVTTIPSGSTSDVVTDGSAQYPNVG